MLKTPLVVDLDGTLLRTDLLHEALVLLLRQRPLYCLLLPFWMLQGRAYLKHRIAQLVTPHIASLPVNNICLQRIQAAANSDREILLATASSHDYALAVQQRFPLSLIHI